MVRTHTFLDHVRPLQGPLVAYARRMLAVPSDVEDVLQETLRTAYTKFSLYVEGTNFRAWVFKILTYQILNANRRHGRSERADVPLTERAEDLAETLDREMEYDRLLADPGSILERLEPALARALGALPAPERSALLLRSIAGLSYREAAEALDIPVGSVIGYLSRARSRLRRDLAAYAVERGLLPRAAAGEEEAP
ncbi:MAG: sigma-70 family RNA polymerase sigma factor [Planctomycetes bacterium]|nr:sigma-70 family RNA polymerase sigma factor [Planctomycetota bacterium]